jgi:hypothetical protein
MLSAHSSTVPKVFIYVQQEVLAMAHTLPCLFRQTLWGKRSPLPEERASYIFLHGCPFSYFLSCFVSLFGNLYNESPRPLYRIEQDLGGLVYVMSMSNGRSQHSPFLPYGCMWKDQEGILRICTDVDSVLLTVLGLLLGPLILPIELLY